MNTQKIRILLAALEQGSLTKAGESLGYTQSGVSWIIKKFEEELGVPLLIKTNSGVEATHEAQAMLPTFRDIINSEEKLMQQADEFRGLHRGTLRVGSFISTSIHWLPQVIAYFRDNYPEIEVHITECGQEDIIRGVLEGSMDLALMSEPDVPDIDFIPVVEDPIVVAFSDAYDFSDHDYVSVEELKDVPVLMTKADYDKDTRKVFKDAGFEPEIRYTSKDDYAVLAMVQHGIGVGVLPELVVEGYPDAFDYRIITPETYRNLGIGIRSEKDASPLAQFFIRFIKENIR